MPFEAPTMDAVRQEFVRFADQEETNLRALCRRYGISPTTGYKWLHRYRQGGRAAVAAQSRRPQHSPTQTAEPIAAQVRAVRVAHPTWGGRKIHRWLAEQGMAAPPAPSTITAILRRHGLLTPENPVPRAYQRFTRAAPNELWQLDFMGHRPLGHGRVHPLTLLDDHSRFGLALTACANEQRDPVQAQLIRCFERYGVPQAILADNGPPWGTSRAGGLTGLEVWLPRLGITVLHGRPAHPQTQGKIERWHRTIAAEVFGIHPFPDLATSQHAFDRFRHAYNTDRPHDALDLAVPATVYHPSPRSYPPVLPEIVYSDDEQVRIVRSKGEIHFQGRRHFLSEGLRGLPVAIRPTTTDGVYTVRFCHRQIVTIDLRTTT